jgi:uncharacterized protein
MLFIYMLEANNEFGPRVRQIYREIERRGDTLCTSVFTVGEVLVGPQKLGATEEVAEVMEFFQSDEIELIPFTLRTVQLYSKIRVTHAVLSADAIQLASAADARSDLFLTNDYKLHKLHIPGIQFIGGLEGKVI